MNEKLISFIISLAIAVTVPSYVVASSWGEQQANQKNIIETLGKIDGKFDRMNEKIDDTRDRVMRMEGALNK